VGDERKILDPGDAGYVDSRTPHHFRRVGPEPCALVSACTPPTFRGGRGADANWFMQVATG